jgi:hypothetical protein
MEKEINRLKIENEILEKDNKILKKKQTGINNDNLMKYIKRPKNNASIKIIKKISIKFVKGSGEPPHSNENKKDNLEKEKKPELKSIYIENNDLKKDNNNDSNKK